MADSIYNSENYESVGSVTPYCDECQTNCLECQDCECEDQNYDYVCGNCEECLTCDRGECVTLCLSECQCAAMGCNSCNTPNSGTTLQYQKK